MKSRYLAACAIAALVAAWSVETRAQRGAPQPEIANSKAAQDLIARAMAIAKDDLKAEATDACLPGGPAREPDRRPMQKIEPLKVFDNLYYVGFEQVGTWTLDTGAGLILFDTLNNPKEAEEVCSFKKEMPEMVFNSHPLTMSDGLMIIGATLILSFLATIIPAKRAGSLAPVDVLRYE